MSASQPTQRPFIGLHFECCNAYGRIYKTAKGDAYAGHCPRCLRPIRFRIEEGGTGQRFFRVR